jgi:hypothetical protein
MELAFITSLQCAKEIAFGLCDVCTQCATRAMGIRGDIETITIAGTYKLKRTVFDNFKEGMSSAFLRILFC